MYSILKSLLTGLGLFLVIQTTQIAQASTVELAGIKVEDSSKVAGKDLKLNGAGIRTKAIFKVYVAALYLPEKTKTVAEVLAMQGPRRVMLTMLREVSADEFGQTFVTALNNNSDKAEKTKIVNQTMQFGEMFSKMEKVKVGDVLTLDWVPNSGTVSTLNGKKVGDTIPDQAFYNAVLKIWLGENPVDSSLKPRLLGSN